MNNGNWVIIEMQVLNVAGFEKRVLYNATKTYSVQLKKADQYGRLNPVIALTITDFEMFNDIEHPISRFILKEKTSLVDYSISDLELVFVELPKFKTPLAGLITLTDKWIYFLQNARDLSVVPETMGAIAEIQQAFDIANQAGLTQEELDELDNQLMFIQDQRGAIIFAEEKGIEQGRRSMQRSIAQKLLATLDDQSISQITGLTIDEIRSIEHD